MFKRYSHFVRRVALVLALVVVMLVGLAASTPTLASAPAAPSTFYSCTPLTVAVFEDRLHVACTVPYNAAITYFAYCTASDSSTASRLLSIFTAAKATGKNVGVYFDPNDTSGTTCGCSSSDCRIVWGADIRP